MNYDPDQSIIIASEAPEQGTGAVLFHTFPDDSQKAVHHAKAERHYSKIAKKTFNVRICSRIFHKTLHGRILMLCANHKPL